MLTDDKIRERCRLMRTKDAAAYLAMSPWQLRNLTQSGEIPVVQFTDRSPFLFDVKDLDRFIEQHKKASPWDVSVLSTA